MTQVAARPEEMLATGGGAAQRAPGRLRSHLAVPLYQNAYALVVNSGLTSTLGLVYWAVAARHYPASEVGRASAEISAMVLISGFAQFNLQSALPRLLPAAGAGTRRLVLSGYAVTAGASALLGTAFVVASRSFGWGGRFLAGSWLVLVWFVVAIVAWTIFTLQDSVLAGLRRAVYVPFENASFAVAKIGLVLALAGAAPRAGLFASWTIPTAISLIPVNWLILRRLVPHHAMQRRERAQAFSRREIVGYVAAEYVGGVFSTVALTVLPLLVASSLGLATTGYFYTAWVVGTSFDLILSQVGISLTVEGANDEDAAAAVARRAVRFGVLLIVPAVVACAALGPTLLSVLGHAYASHGSVVLRCIVIAVVPRSITFFYMSMCRIRRRARNIAAVQSVLCGLVLLLAWTGLQRWGLNGVGYGYAAAQTIVGVALLPAVVRMLRMDASTPMPTPEFLTDSLIADVRG